MFPLIEQPVSQYIWQTYIWLSWLSHLLTWLFSTSLKKKDYCASQSLSRNGNPLQYSCLENSMDRGAWWATVHGAAESWTWLSTYTQRPLHCMPAPECPSKRLHHRLPCPNLQLFLFQGQWPSHLPQPMSIYSKTQSHIFFHANWMTDSVPEGLAMKRIFASIVFGDHPEWYWSTATIHFQLAPMYQDHPSMKLTRDFPSSVNQSSLALQRSTWSRGNELREGGWCSRDGQPVCVCVCVWPTWGNHWYPSILPMADPAWSISVLWWTTSRTAWPYDSNGSGKTQLMLSSSGCLATCCPMVRCFVSIRD